MAKVSHRIKFHIVGIIKMMLMKLLHSWPCHPKQMILTSVITLNEASAGITNFTALAMLQELQLRPLLAHRHFRTCPWKCCF